MKVARESVAALAVMSMLGGCVVVVEGPPWHDSDPPQHYGHYDMWFNDAAVYCEYSVSEQLSHWTLVANPDTSYGPAEIEEVYTVIDGSYLYTSTNLFWLAPVEEGEWRATFDNIGTPENSYHCINSYDFLFAAYDYEGRVVSRVVEW